MQFLFQHTKPFLDHLALFQGCSPNTITAYADELQRLETLCAQQALTDFSYESMNALITNLRDRGNQSVTVHRKVAVLRSLTRYVAAFTDATLPHDPLVVFPRLVDRVPETPPRWLTDPEVRQLKASLKTHTRQGIREATIVTVLLNTGLRVSELAGLDLTDVDLKAAQLTVAGKGGRRRTIALNSTTVNALRNYLKIRPQDARTPAFFVSRKGGRYTNRGLEHMTRRLAERAGLPHFSPHALRHTFATQALDGGMKLFTLQEILGHRCLTSTQVYLHLSLKHQRQALARHPAQTTFRDVMTAVPDDPAILPEHGPYTRRE